MHLFWTISRKTLVQNLLIRSASAFVCIHSFHVQTLSIFCSIDRWQLKSYKGQCLLFILVKQISFTLQKHFQSFQFFCGTKKVQFFFLKFVTSFIKSLEDVIPNKARRPVSNCLSFCVVLVLLIIFQESVNYLALEYQEHLYLVHP